VRYFIPVPQFWYPVYGHPLFEASARSALGARSFLPERSNAFPEPWYRVEEGFVYTTPAHPHEPADLLRFREQAAFYLPVEGGEAWFEREGTLIYPAPSHPEVTTTTLPWFQQR